MVLLYPFGDESTVPDISTMTQNLALLQNCTHVRINTSEMFLFTYETKKHPFGESHYHTVDFFKFPLTPVDFLIF